MDTSGAASDGSDNGTTSTPTKSKYITLISNDGLEFVVLREAALVSPYIVGMLRSGMAEARTGRCEFHEIRFVGAVPFLFCSIYHCPWPLFASHFPIVGWTMKHMLYPTDHPPPAVAVRLRELGCLRVNYT